MSDEDTKKISRSSYVWSHVAVIIFHILLAILLILTYFYDKLGKVESKTVVFVIGIVLLLMSLGSFVPILMDNKKIEID